MMPWEDHLKMERERSRMSLKSLRRVGASNLIYSKWRLLVVVGLMTILLVGSGGELSFIFGPVYGTGGFHADAMDLIAWAKFPPDGFGDANNKVLGDWIEFEGYLYVGVANFATGLEVWRTSGGDLETWSQVGADGFGDPSNIEVAQFEEFQSEVYASVDPDGAIARIFRSSDGVAWHQIGADGFGDAANWRACLYSFGSYLMAFTDNGATGMEIWTWDGSTWTQRMSDGIDGDPGNFLSEGCPPDQSFTEFNGYLYVSTSNIGGTELWRSSDGVNWNRANDDGFGDAMNTASDMVEFNGDLYAVTSNSATGFEVWRSGDGTSWSKIGDDGFGDVNNNYGGGLRIFRDELYLTTFNLVVPGVRVWRSSDGDTWNQVGSSGFGDPNNQQGLSTVAGDYLYVGAFNWATGVEVWRSGDGASWSQINQDGFGDVDNHYGRFFVFKNHLYVGTDNDPTGVEVWRLTEPVEVPDFRLSLDAASVSMPQGQIGQRTVTLTSLNGFSGSVDLSGEWLTPPPTGVTYAYYPSSVDPSAGTAEATLSITASPDASTGTFTLSVIGRNAGLTRGVELEVVITARAAPPPPVCLIVTAAYGSELSDDVEFVRSFRDDSIMETKTGSSFMVAFNAWYYSYSPSVAGFITEHSALRTATRIALYPLMFTIRLGAAVFNLFPTALEFGAVGSLLLVGSLVGVFYLAGPLTAALACSIRARRLVKEVQAPTLVVLLSALAAVAFLVFTCGPLVLMMLATSTLVLTSLVASALFSSQVVLHLAKRL